MTPVSRSREQLATDVAAILAIVGVDHSLSIAQVVLDDITADHYLRPRPIPKGRKKCSPEEYRERLQDKWRRDELSNVRKNDQTMTAARNRWQEWTSHELEVLSRDDLSLMEIADMLGRTLFGVKHARKRLKDGHLGKRRGDGARWTGPELEIAARQDLSAKQVADMVGRSTNAVYRIRTALRRDPRKYLLAGTPRVGAAYQNRRTS